MGSSDIETDSWNLSATTEEDHGKHEQVKWVSIWAHSEHLTYGIPVCV
jgi:hypothetical protein